MRPRQLGFIALASACALLFLLRPSPSAGPALSLSALEVEAPLLAIADLDRDGIRRAVVEQFLPTAKRCYRELLRRDPAAHGRITLIFEVRRRDDRGVVTNAELGPNPEIHDAAFHACLLDGIRAVVFDPPHDDDTIQVIYPFDFRPRASADAI